MNQTLPITFLLNEEIVSDSVPPGLVALDYLRKRRQLTGSKEGCKEGDCGACTVIVGELQGGKVNYRPMTSCLLPMGELHGKHLVSIEGLNSKELSPIQSAMVDCGGTQCGYCTPGFVVAMTAGLMDEKVPLNKEGADYAISGNLCRCTGYRSIKAAGKKAIDEIIPLLKEKPRIEALCEAKALPAAFMTAGEKLKSIAKEATSPYSESNYDGPIVAGGTDLFVQKGEEIPDQLPRLLNTHRLEPARLAGDEIIIDARMSFEAFARDPLIKEYIPSIGKYNDLMASWPIRTRATLAGNICNASPIADMTCLLMALEARLKIAGKETTIPLRKFYLGYKKLGKDADELIEQIIIPKITGSVFVNWEKVSKRKILDIATVNSAAKFEVQDGTIKRATIAVGGVAATPLYLSETSSGLTDQPLTIETVHSALDTAQKEFNPISDVRGSATYKRLLARQLIAAHFTTLFPEQIKEEALYETLR